MNVDRTAVLLAIRPVYSDGILDLSKRIEFRRRGLPAEVRTVVLWRTGPGGGLVGQFTVAKQERGTAASWVEALNAGRRGGYGISAADLLAYAGGPRGGLAGITVQDVVAYPRRVAPTDLDASLITTPQSWRYAPDGYEATLAELAFGVPA